MFPDNLGIFDLYLLSWFFSQKIRLTQSYRLHFNDGLWI